MSPMPCCSCGNTSARNVRSTHSAHANAASSAAYAVRPQCRRHRRKCQAVDSCRPSSCAVRASAKKVRAPIKHLASIDNIPSSSHPFRRGRKRAKGFWASGGEGAHPHTCGAAVER